MNQFNLLILIILLSFSGAYTQSVLDSYIKEGLANNIVLQQKKISYQKAGYALKIATSYFFPTVAFKADYTSGEGGRSIAIPVGDLMNPVYATLNQLTQSNRFPQISNVEQDFFPYKFYDVKLRATMPLLNTDIYFNREITKSKELISGYEIDSYKRDLIKEIKVAYYNYLSAEDAVKIYKAAYELAAEGKRTNEKLLENGVGLPVYVLRAESEMEAVKSSLTEAEVNRENAKRYFNFLINRSPETDIETGEITFPATAEELNGNEITKREELKMLSTAIEINRTVNKMNKFDLVPKINAFFDYGAQDQVWNLGDKSKYYLFGFMLEVPLFESFRSNYKSEESELEIRNAELELENITKKLQLSNAVSKGKVDAARQNYLSAKKQLETAESYHRLIEKGYKEGINSFIETVDARTQLTQARLLLNINKFKVLSALAEFNRESASEIISKYE